MDLPIRLRDGIDSSKSLHIGWQHRPFPWLHSPVRGARRRLTRARREALRIACEPHQAARLMSNPIPKPTAIYYVVSSGLHPDRDIPGPSLNRVLGIR